MLGGDELSNSTPVGGVTVQVSVYEVPITFDPDPDSVTSGGTTTAAYTCHAITYKLQN